MAFNSGQNHMDSLFTKEEQKKTGSWHESHLYHIHTSPAHDVTDTYATHSSPVCDVTDTAYQTQRTVPKAVFCVFIICK